MSKRRFNGRANRFKLYCAANRSADVKVVRHVGYDAGQKLVKDGLADAVRDFETGTIVGFQYRACRNMTAAADSGRAEPMKIDSRASCVAFSRAEVEAIVGMRGDSQTAGLNEDQKAARIMRGWQAEDLVESARKKLAVYSRVH